MADFAPTVQANPSTHSGYRGTNDAIVTGRVKADIRDELVLVEPKTTPAMFMLSKVREKKTATQYKFGWIEKRPFPRFFTITEAYAGGSAPGASVSLTAAAQSARIPPRSIIRERVSGELFWVQSVNTGTHVLTCLAFLGGTGVDAAIDDNAEFDIISDANVDGADINTSFSVVDDLVENFTQIFRKSYAFTGRDLTTSLYGGKDLVGERKWAAVEHSKNLEFAFFFGKKQQLTDSTSGKLLTTTGGLDWHIKTNRYDVGNAWPTEDEFNAAMDYALRDGPSGYLNGKGEKTLFAPPELLVAMQGWAADRLHQTIMDKQYGMVAWKYETPFGSLNIMRTPSLNGALSGGIAFIVDMAAVRLRPHADRDTKIYEDRQGNGVDGYAEEIMTDCGFQIEQEKAHMVIYKS